MKLKSIVALFSCSLLALFICGCADETVVDSTVPDSEAIADSSDGELETSDAPVAGADDEHPYITVDNSNFEELVLKSEQPVMIDFWAPWCGPCRVIAPAVEELAAEYQGKAVVAKVNIDDAPELAEKYEVRGIPTLIFIRNGERVDEIVGARPKDEIEAKLAAVTAEPGSTP